MLWGEILMDKKKKINWFKITIVFLFIAYISLYALNMTGYYNGSMRKKVEFTESQIREFEKDVALGEKVDINDYLEKQTKDYTNGASRLGYTISKNLDEFLNKGIKNIINLLGKLLS